MCFKTIQGSSRLSRSSFFQIPNSRRNLPRSAERRDIERDTLPQRPTARAPLDDLLAIGTVKGKYKIPYPLGRRIEPFSGQKSIKHGMRDEPNPAQAAEEAIPKPFLDVRVKELDLVPALVGLCVGYEAGRWRSQELVQHMMEWLPEFALTYSERKSLAANSAVRLIRAAVRSIYATEKFKNRGEFGELLLHIAIRQVFNTLPAISKIYYKDADNVTIKGFDAVHVVAGDTSLELWIGESKFYTDISKAIADVLEELKLHTEDAYLRREFAAIVNKIDAKWPYAERLRKLLDANTSLDTVFDAACIPVLLTYDSKAVSTHQKLTEEYVAAFTSEVKQHHATFASRQLPNIRIHLFLIPLKSKEELVKELDEGLKRWQQL